MKSSIPHNQRKSFKKWALPVQILKPQTTFNHFKITANKTADKSMAKHNNGAFGYIMTCKFGLA